MQVTTIETEGLGDRSYLMGVAVGGLGPTPRPPSPTSPDGWTAAAQMPPTA